jgi:predicted nucleic acid-binding protein
MDRVFLDANVLFSAAYKPSRLRELWEISSIQLVSSTYALQEAEVNLGRIRKEALSELDPLVKQLLIFKEHYPLAWNFETISLEEKDRPILLAAIACKADYLLTGDKQHFGHLYNIKVRDVMILTPSQFFALKGR